MNAKFSENYRLSFVVLLTPVDVCEPKNPCKNGGVCKPQDDSYFCQCKPGYQGKNCDKGTMPTLFYAMPIVNVVMTPGSTFIETIAVKIFLLH